MYLLHVTSRLILIAIDNIFRNHKGHVAVSRIGQMLRQLPPESRIRRLELKHVTAVLLEAGPAHEDDGAAVLDHGS